MTVRCGDIHGMTVSSQRFYHSGLADKSVKFWTAPTKARRAVLGRDAKNRTDMRKARRGERKREKRDAFS
ncbi:MAG: hypothetical protein QM445_09835 [Thermotogota bacterium]|nr:hypothetical protein [Thermotogota bacterium]